MTRAADDNRLGVFLRARRDRLAPAEAGVPIVGPRRVPGLRREELAALAGVSVAYYTRLERGRDRHPSPQVLDALARALRLDEPARRHLHDLAPATPAARPAAAPLAQAPAGVARIVADWPGPATAADETGLVLAANPLARALSPAYAPGVNAYRALFADPAIHALHEPDWDRIAAEVVAGLRAAAGPAPDDERLVTLIGELSIASERFRELWAHADVCARASSGVTRMRHPLIGPISLHYEKLAATSHPGVGLVLFSVGPASEDASALRRLRALASPLEAGA